MKTPMINIGLKVPSSGRALEGPIKTLYTLDYDYLREHPNTPPLYKSGVRYRNGKVDWFSIPEVLAARTGDCKDLACWRTAELRLQGINAVPRLSRKGNMWHVTVKLPDGTIEDPSRILGMH
jgi:hypothetical protein